MKGGSEPASEECFMYTVYMENHVTLQLHRAIQDVLPPRTGDTSSIFILLI